jgi:hypothetical protein
MGEEKGANGWSILDQPRRRVRNKLRDRKMTQVILTGKTKHGKDRIRQHGNVWNVTSMSMPVAPHKMMLESLHETTTLRVSCETLRFKDARSIDKSDDKDFDWQFI